jgi:hypothetical protein
MAKTRTCLQRKKFVVQLRVFLATFFLVELVTDYACAG